MIKILKKLNSFYFVVLATLLTFKVSFARTDVEQEFSINNPLDENKFGSVQAVIAEFLKWIINIGVVAVTLAFIYTGFQFVAARGNPEALQKAKASFLWTVVGTLVLLGAQVLSEVIKNTLTQGGIGS